MTGRVRTDGRFAFLVWVSRIRLARNAMFSIGQIVISTVALFWMYRRSVMLVGLSGLGTWSVTIGLASLLVVVDCGLTEAMVREVARFRAREDWSGVRVAVVSCVCSVAPAIVFIGLMLFPVLRLVLHSLLPHVPNSMTSLLIVCGVVVVALNSASAGLLGAIEGFERYDLRLAIAACSSTSLVLSSFVLLVPFGTFGISASFLIQSIVSVAACACVLRRLIPPKQAFGVRLLSLREIHRLSKIGIPLRLGTLVNLTYEPVTRFLVAKFGGMESAGIYEAAVRCGIQSKAVIVACIQVVLPRLSALAVEGNASLRILLRISYKITGLLVVGVLPIILLAVPTIAHLLLGGQSVRFEIFASILSTGWLVNALAAPPNYANLADGKLFWNWFSNLCAALLNPAVGLLLGPVLGSIGVVLGTAGALMTTAAIAIIARGINSGDWSPRPGRDGILLIAFAIFLMVLQWVLRSPSRLESETLIVSLSLTAAYAWVWMNIALQSFNQIVLEVSKR